MILCACVRYDFMRWPPFATQYAPHGTWNNCPIELKWLWSFSSLNLFFSGCPNIWSNPWIYCYCYCQRIVESIPRPRHSSVIIYDSRIRIEPMNFLLHHTLIRITVTLYYIGTSNILNYAQHNVVYCCLIDNSSIEIPPTGEQYCVIYQNVIQHSFERSTRTNNMTAHRSVQRHSGSIDLPSQPSQSRKINTFE